MSSSSTPDSQAALEASVRSAPGTVALLDTGMRYLAWSEAWIRDHDLGARGSLAGVSHYEVFPELDDGWKAIHSYCLRGHTEQGDVELFTHPDGRTSWGRSVIRPWTRDRDSSEIGGLILSRENLADQIEAQRQLAQQKSLLDTVIRHAPAAVYAFDGKGRVTLSIGQGLSNLGAGAVGTSLLDDYAHFSGLDVAIETVLSGESVSWESEADGQFFETSAVATVEDGAVTGGLAVAVDVTDRVLAQTQALLQAEGLRRVLSVTSRPGSFEMQMQALLAEVSGFLDLEGGVLARVDGDVFRCVSSVATDGEPIAPGTERPLASTYCTLLLEADDVVAIDRIGETEHASHPAYLETPYEAYIGAPVYVEGQRYGTLSFRSKRPSSRPFADSDRDLVRLASQWAGGLLERDQRAQETSDQADRLRALADLFAVRSGSVDDQVRDALALLCRQIGLDVGVFSRVHIEVGTYEVLAAHRPDALDLAEGTTASLGDTYCTLTLDADDVVAIDDAQRPPEARHALASVLVPEAFIAAPIVVDEAVYGLVDFSSLTPRAEPFTESDRDLVRLVASWVSGLVERSRQATSHTPQRAVAEYHNQAKRSLLDAMSHEIRTPMNAVVGFGDLLVTTDLDERQIEYVGTIRRAGERLLRLIDDVLDYSKIEADRIELVDEPFDIAKLCAEILDQFAPAAARKAVELNYRIDDPGDGSSLVPQRVVGDEQRIHQVISNLVSNAVKFTASGSVDLIVRVSGVRDNDPPGALPLEFEVLDTGIGVSSDRLMQVFEPFVQADSSTTRQYGGIGLGLAISRQLTEKMGGAIEADSQVGIGSRFRVRIPVFAVEHVERRVVRPSWMALSGLSVCVVDDDETALQITTDQCQAWGMSVRTTTDPETLLRWLDAGETFHVGILDMQMPTINGINFAKKIREHHTSDHLPLVILSSDDRARHAPGLVQAVLQKPVSSATLHALLLRVAGTHGAAPRGLERKPTRDLGPDRAPTPRPVRILVAEDEPDNLTLTLHMLRTLGYEAEVAGDGAEALAMMQAVAYDLVFMDVMMPQMDGLEATRRLRASNAVADQPRVIALTARALRSDREACLQAGMDDYLSKPVRIGDLARALDAVA